MRLIRIYKVKNARFAATTLVVSKGSWEDNDGKEDDRVGGKKKWRCDMEEKMWHGSVDL